MTIERGKEWGRQGIVPADAATLASDRAVAQHVARGVLGAGEPGGGGPLVVRLAGGDLYRTLGRPPLVVAGDPARLVPVDALRLRLGEGAVQVAVAHVVARRSWWRGPVVAVMNAQFVGQFDVAPRSHPNDGLADIVETTTMAVSQRWHAWRRLPNGTHVPHPAVRERRLPAVEMIFERPLRVWLDGEAAGEARTLTVEVVPDAFLVAV